MRNAHTTRGVCVLAVTATALGAACTNPDQQLGAAAPETISGSIYYDGDVVAPGRPLAIAVYASFPPSGPPLAVQLIERYELPYHYRFSGLKPGRYYVGALIDVDRMDTPHAGMLNRARDPFGYVGAGAPIELEANRGVAGADISLVEAPR